jgi:hypothetical protein
VGRARIQLISAVLLGAAMAVGCGDDDEPAAERTQTVQTEPRTTPAPETDTAESTDTVETDTGAATDSDEAGGLPDTCGLLSASEVRAAAGRDVDPQEEKGDTVDGFPYRQCNWTAVGFDDSAAVRVVSSTKRYDTLLRDLGGAGAEIEKLSGLGDAAFLASGFSGESAGGTRGSTIFVKAGGRTYSLALANAQDEGPREELIELMEKMLSRAG